MVNSKGKAPPRLGNIIHLSVALKSWVDPPTNQKLPIRVLAGRALKLSNNVEIVQNHFVISEAEKYEI